MEGTMVGSTVDREIGLVRMQAKSDFPSQLKVAQLQGASPTSIRSADPEPAAPDSGNTEAVPRRARAMSRTNCLSSVRFLFSAD